MRPVAFTLDLEDHRPHPSAEPRYPDLTRRLLDDLDEWGVKGTVFVVGDVVDESPGLIRDVAARGHELALHGAHHTSLVDVDPHRFRDETAAARDRLADTAGAAVSGYRAPMFSLVPESAWAPAILAELGFEYSSSVLPARNPLHGWPGAPFGPFRWPCGLIELPCPVFGYGPVRVPLLGGTYLRVFPPAFARWARGRLDDRVDGWLYAHPYDFDPDEPRWPVPEVGRIGSRLLWWNRRTMRDRVRGLVEGSTRTLHQMAGDLTAPPVFDPGGERS